MSKETEVKTILRNQLSILRALHCITSNEYAKEVLVESIKETKVILNNPKVTGD